jgi:hypothetical protein
MRKKEYRESQTEVPLDFALHGVQCKSAVGELIGEGGKVEKLKPIEVRALLPLVRTLLNNPDGHDWTFAYDIAEEVYPNSNKKYRGWDLDKKKEEVNKRLSEVRNKIRNVHLNEDIIEYSEHRDCYRIKPAILCSPGPLDQKKAGRPKKKVTDQQKPARQRPSTGPLHL